MSTKRFVWKDRDTAALDLLQLAYHAPQFISTDALHILSAIRSEVIVADLKEITLDSDRDYWERINALRAISRVRGDIYFPELILYVDEDLVKYEQAIARLKDEDAELDSISIFKGMVGEIIAFAAWHPSNRSWIWERLDRADPLIVASIYSDPLGVDVPHEMTTILLHRLITLFEVNPHLLSLRYAHEIYFQWDSDNKAKTFLEEHFDAILQLAITSHPAERSKDELHWAIPFEWSELKAAIFQQRPDFEEKYYRDEARLAAQRSKFQERRREDYSYKDTAIWHELESLYDQAHAGDNQAYWKLSRKIYDSHLSIPARAAATHFFAKLREYPKTIDRLIWLVASSQDTWEDYYSPVRFEAGRALFEIATPAAWEALIAAFFVCRTNMLQDCLEDWIECLTDKLSGVEPTYEESDQYTGTRWFKALSTESQT